VQLDPAVEEQPRPGGELDIVPLPVPAKSTVTVGPVPEKHTTFAVMYPVTIAPEADNPLASLLVVSVAETRVAPQAFPVAVNNPAESTVNICVVFDDQVT